MEKRAPAVRAAMWVTPAVFAIALYWRGINAWFQMDDFAWLNLRNLAARHSIGWVLFQPFAEGTVRILSDRLFFLSMHAVFGIRALPYHVVGLVTFLIAQGLLQSIGTKLTGSRAAGFWAAMLWTANGALAGPLAWVSFYNELLWAACVAIGVWLLLRYIETGERRFFVAQWATFIVGFGVLELNVVYPAIALGIVLCRAPHLARKIAWMLPVSAAYAAVHFAIAPAPASGPYQLHWDGHMLTTLALYAYWALGTAWSGLAGIGPIAVRIALAAPIAAGLVVFAIAKIRERQWLVVLFPAWFVIVLAPLLPLRDHPDFGYLTTPTLGLAMLGGWAVVAGWRAQRVWTGLVATLYLGVSAATAFALASTMAERSERLKATFDAIEELHRQRPVSTAILTGVDRETFTNMIGHGALGLIGIQRVYVDRKDAPFAQAFFVDPAVARQMLEEGTAAVYDLRGGARDVTQQYRAGLEELAAKIELGDERFAGQLGPTWYGIENGYRWMPMRAWATLRGSGRHVAIRGFCPAAALAGGPITVAVTANGQKLPAAKVARAESAFELKFDLPASSEDTVVIEIALDRTFHAAGDPRELGLPITSIEIQQ